MSRESKTRDIFGAASVDLKYPHHPSVDFLNTPAKPFYYFDKLDPFQPSQTELSRQAHNLINAFNIIDGQYIRHIDLAL